MGWGRRCGAAAAAAVLLFTGCASVELRSAHPDPLCAALDDFGAAGLAAALSGVPRVLGEEQDRVDADRRAASARAALARLREEVPADLASDAATVTRALERWILALNNPEAGPGDLVAAAGSAPEEINAFRDSAHQVNALTERRCGRPLIDPSQLGS